MGLLLKREERKRTSLRVKMMRMMSQRKKLLRRTVQMKRSERKRRKRKAKTHHLTKTVTLKRKDPRRNIRRKRSTRNTRRIRNIRSTRGEEKKAAVMNPHLRRKARRKEMIVKRRYPGERAKNPRRELRRRNHLKKNQIVRMNVPRKRRRGKILIVKVRRVKMKR